MNWTEKYDVPLYDFEVSCNYKSSKIFGRGVDENKDVALEKASSELVEKIICLENGIDSVGLAASVVVEAKAHAQNEALERYYLKSHLDRKIGFEDIKSDIAPTFYNFLDRVNCEVQFYKMRNESDGNGIVCFLNHRENSELFSFGFSFGQDLSACTHKALIEALPNLIWKIENPNAETDIWQISFEFKNRIKPLFSLPVNADAFVAAAQLKAVEIKNCNHIIESISGLKISKFEVWV